ncbi:MAG: sodium:proton antiporter, partial [Acidobacteria bacterium]|nr:sodium:proton antiporter [Acidobacteriota bacterium]
MVNHFWCSTTPGDASSIPLWTVLPFLGLLLSIAILPLVAGHWWHENRNKAKTAAIFGLPSVGIALYYEPSALGHTALEYLAFICLLGSLFVISGGVRVRGALAGTPLANTGILGLGAILANFVGTTGAAMLLIRPYLHANRRRKSRVHLIIFFIFIVANCGGCLTPLGDPPLFLGFLKGVPFQWTLGLWKPWLVVVGTLLVLFNLLDQHRFHREDLES